MTDRYDNKARQQLIVKFLTIAKERVDRLNNAFLELEQDPDNQATVSLVLREIHTLKGEAKLMGFADVNLVAHKTEDLILFAKQKQYRMSPELVDGILKGFDIISSLLSKQSGGATQAIDLNAFTFQVDQLLNERLRDSAAVPPMPPGESPRPSRMQLDLQTESSIRVEVPKLDRLTDLLGELLRYQTYSEQALLALGQLGQRWSQEMQHWKTAIAVQPAEDSREQLAQSLRLIHQQEQALRALHGEFNKMISGATADIYEGRDRLSELERTIRELRLLPLSTLVQRYPRAIRDLAKEQRKQVQVTITGGDLELDKQVLDQLGEPLLHLIRNAIDHGLESPEERRAAGKPEEGAITLLARQEGTRVELSVSDDGRGLSSKVIHKTVVAKGLLDEAEADLLDAKELMQFIFRAGFTTRTQATDLSGRGIGLDVVKERLESLGGSVRVQSEYGRGTTIVLDVPVSVALMRALIVKSGSGSYAIPSYAIQTILEIDPPRVERAGAGWAFQFDGCYYSLHDLSQLLGNNAASTLSNRVVLVQNQGRQFGLRVDGILGEQDLVQRPSGPFLRALHLFIGTAMLEHTSPILILNVAEIYRRIETTHRREAAVYIQQGPRETRCVLLVEDSELTRDMLANVLLAMGHEILEAANGRDAFEQLQQKPPDLVLTDLEMPIMDGFELIKKIRSAGVVPDVPIIVLSSRGSEQDKRHAAELGADAYLVKTNFHEETLRATVDRFLQQKES